MRKNLVFLFLMFSIFLTAQEKSVLQTNFFDFKKVEGTIKILPTSRLVKGKVSYIFETLRERDTLYIDGRDMEFKDVFLNGKKVSFYSDKSRLYVISQYLPSKNNLLKFEYTVSPKSGMYFINWDFKDVEAADKQVWTQGQGKYTSTWLPSFDDIEEKAEFDLSFEFPVGYTVVSNGVLKKKSTINDSLNQWEFDMKDPMSSYLVGFSAGNYESEIKKSSSGDSIQLFYRPEDSLKLEPTYRYSTQIFDFLENEIGMPYPWQNYKQIPVLDFLYAGMENTGATIFANSMVTDSIGFKDRNYVNVNAHELAHQWFGDLVTEKEGHHWLQEGFATYYALLAEREIFGNEYYYWKLYETAENLKKLSDSGKGEAVVSSGSSSLTYYQKGAWALHILRERIGDEAFKNGIKKYLQLYKFQNVETDNFIAEMEMASGQDLSQFVKDWLQQSAFKATEALESLKKSEFIRDYLDIAALRETPLEQKYELLESTLDFPVNDYIGQEVVHQLAGLTSEKANSLYTKAFKSKNVFVRQAIALTMENIPQNLKTQFESLLEDDSYLTMEAALYKLWERFPEDRAKYFDKTRGINGFYNKNVKMMWLTLNLVTPEFEPQNTQYYYEELARYTAQWRPFEVRQNAFGYLFQIGTFNTQSLKSLINGTNHPNWNFRKYCRELLTELLENEEYRQKLITISESMKAEETVFLHSKITD